MMQTNSTEVVAGQISSNGTSMRGPMRSERVAQGSYLMKAPPGKQLLGMSVSPIDGPTIFRAERVSGTSMEVVMTNTGGTAQDIGFEYVAVLSG